MQVCKLRLTSETTVQFPEATVGNNRSVSHVGRYFRNNFLKERRQSSSIFIILPNDSNLQEPVLGYNYVGSINLIAVFINHFPVGSSELEYTLMVINLDIGLILFLHQTLPRSLIVPLKY